jgi:hypothetical protein
VQADFTRNSLDPLKHFSQVLMQQGQVQLDADWNEQAGILLHLIRRLAVDQFGSAFAPQFGGGFRIFALSPQQPGEALDFGIQPGVFYVDGVRCELEATPVPIVQPDPNQSQTIKVVQWTVDGVPFQVGQYLRLWDGPVPLFPTGAALSVSKIRFVHYDKMTLDLDRPQSGEPKFAQRIVTYNTQPDLPKPVPLQQQTNYLIYLDVWERLITCLEDDSIREVALNGPDTAGRARVVWQVKALPTTAFQAQDQASIIQLLQPPTRGLLCAQARRPDQGPIDPCTISPASRYRGAENQLYRVEIHTGNLVLPGQPRSNASFKWSRDNGAAIFPIVKPVTSTSDKPSTTTVTLGNLGRDDRFGLAVGDYVEIQDDNSVLNNVTGKLLQVQSIDRNNLVVVLTDTTPEDVGKDLKLHPLLRRWDHKSGDPRDGALPIPSEKDKWIELEDGVQVSFVSFEGATPIFRSGDYWLIPARVATGDVIWPTETGPGANGQTITSPVAKPPDGITHHYASLGPLTL